MSFKTHTQRVSEHLKRSEALGWGPAISLGLDKVNGQWKPSSPLSCSVASVNWVADIHPVSGQLSSQKASPQWALMGSLVAASMGNALSLLLSTFLFLLSTSIIFLFSISAFPSSCVFPFIFLLGFASRWPGRKKKKRAAAVPEGRTS